MKKILSFIILLSIVFGVNASFNEYQFNSKVSGEQYDIYRENKGVQNLVEKLNNRLGELYKKNPIAILSIQKRIDTKLGQIKTGTSRYYILASISENITSLESEKVVDDNIIVDITNKRNSYSSTKSFLESDVYNGTNLKRETFYCGCDYSSDKEVDKNSCGFENNGKYENREDKIEWEHIVPAEAFGQSFVEWREGHTDCVDSKGKTYKGRKCAEKVNEVYKVMQADPMNLVPSIGSINAQRSNYSFSVITGEERQFGTCDFEISDRKVEPKEEVRGDIARIYMYMETTYPGHGVISNKNEKLFEAWNKEDPIDDIECKKYKAVGIESDIWKSCK